MTVLMFSLATPTCSDRMTIAIIKRMIDLKMHMNDVDRDNNTALIYAARYGAADLCKLLIKHGAEVNKISNGFYGPKMTALDYALCDKVKHVLKSHGARTYDEITGNTNDAEARPRVSSICYDYGGRSRSDSRKRDRTDSFGTSTATSPGEQDTERNSVPSTSSNSTSASSESWWTCSCIRPKGSP